jgi:hypothetical protein
VAQGRSGGGGLGGGGAPIIDRFVPRPSGGFTHPGWGWASYLLPHLEQGPLDRSCRRDFAVENPLNDGPRQVVVPVYVCPSDRNTGVFVPLDEADAPTGPAGTNSYAACWGSWYIPTPDPGDGVFYKNSRTRLGEITDGTSTTIALGERAALFAQAPWAGAMSFATLRTTPGAPVYLSESEPSYTQVMARVGRKQLNDPYSEPYDFFSPHQDKVFFLFADGSVRPVTSSADPAHVRALATRAGGEVLDGNGP